MKMMMMMMTVNMLNTAIVACIAAFIKHYCNRSR